MTDSAREWAALQSAYISKRRTDKTRKDAENRLQNAVLACFLAGMSYTEICQGLGLSSHDFTLYVGMSKLGLEQWAATERASLHGEWA